MPRQRNSLTITLALLSSLLLALPTQSAPCAAKSLFASHDSEMRGAFERVSPMLVVATRAAPTRVRTKRQSGGAGESRSLTPGSVVESELAGGGAHRYRIALTAGQYLRAEVEQLGVDLALRLRAPNGAHLAEMDGLTTPTGTEDLGWEAVEPGEYMLEIISRAPLASTVGRYMVRVNVAAAAGEPERARIEAQRLYTQGRMAQAEGSRAELERALQIYDAALLKWRESGERKWEAATYNNLGIISWRINQYERAREHYERALTINRELGDKHSESRIHNNIGINFWSMEQYEGARKHYELALTISRGLGDRLGESRALTNLGVIHKTLTEYESALECYKQALAISREFNDKRIELSTHNNLGIVYWNLGQYERGREHYELALTISRELGDRDADIHMNLGALYSKLNLYEKAREQYEQALIITRELEDKAGEGFALHNFADLYRHLSQHERARDYLERSLVIRRGVNDRLGEGRTLTSLGIVHRALRQNEQSRLCYENSLSISREVGDRQGEAEVLYELARLGRDTLNFDSAREHAEAALMIVESLRSTLTDQSLRSSFFASVQDYYALYIDLLMSLHGQQPSAGHASAALAASERARARGLLDLLSEARADLRQGADPRLVERKRSVQRQLNAKAAAQQQLFVDGHLPGKRAEIEREIAALANEYKDVQAQIRRTSPRYASLTQPQPLTLREMQTQLLDRETLLLVYSLGSERSYLWAVTPTSLTSFTLPKREAIESASRRVYELLTMRNRFVQGETPQQRRSRLTQAEADYKTAAVALSEMVLGQVAVQLSAKPKRLLLVCDGALQYVPFAALPLPSATSVMNWGGSKVGAPLAVEHEIVTLPSASSLAMLRREAGGRQRPAKTVAVLADPVFSLNDDRVIGVSSKPKDQGQDQPQITARHTRARNLNVVAQRDVVSPVAEFSIDLERALQSVDVEAGSTGIARLPFSRREAEAIFSSAPRGTAMNALGFEANRRTATGSELAGYRIVHFATHGILNSEHPELSGLVLSLIDERGRAQDGFLRLHEVYNLNLSAELVVLSACQTGLGKEIKGEGLVGLTRGFMYAGAGSVMASLWKVNDFATAELMKKFYTKMLRDGQRPAAALRAAQIEMWREGEGAWRSPYYWAAFVLQGEWR